MKRSWFNQIMVIVLLIIGCFGVIFIFHLEALRALSNNSVEISPNDNYSLNQISDRDLVFIEATPNRLFVFESEDYVLFSTEEYQFDFILLSSSLKNERAEYACRDVTESQSALLQSTTSEFNEPIDTTQYDIFSKEGIVSEEGRRLLEEETTGRFGDLTRLLDCREELSIGNTTEEIYGNILIESTLLFGGILLIFREKLLFITRHIHDKHSD